MRDPRPEEAWKPDQFWVCPACGRHFWTTYPAPKADPPAKPPGQGGGTPESP